MKFTSPAHIRSIASLLSCEVKGNTDLLVSGINEIHMVENGDIVFVDHPKYFQKALDSAASVILINEEVACPEGKALLIHPKPFDAFNELTQYFAQQMEELAPQVHESAIVFPTAHLGKNVRIGAHSIIHPGAYIADHTQIDSHVIIGPNSVIGFDAFYYKKKQEGYDRLLSCGAVHIASHVEIGAQCTIDRGVTGITSIGKGTKIDNQVHIGHDTKIGEQVLIAASCGISGCVEIGNHVTIWGQVGMASGIIVADHAVILGQSGLSKNVPEGAVYFGSPAGPAKEKFRELAHLRQQINS